MTDEFTSFKTLIMFTVAASGDDGEQLHTYLRKSFTYISGSKICRLQASPVTTARVIQFVGMHIVSAISKIVRREVSNENRSLSIDQCLNTKAQASSSYVVKSSIFSRQAHEQVQHLDGVGSTEASDRVPSLAGSETGSTTTLVTSLSDIVQNLRMSVEGGINETDTALTSLETSLVDDGDDSTECRRRSRSTVDESKGSVYSDDVIGSIGGDIREAASLLCVVEAVGAVWWGEVLEPRLDSR